MLSNSSVPKLLILAGACNTLKEPARGLWEILNKSPNFWAKWGKIDVGEKKKREFKKEKGDSLFLEKETHGCPEYSHKLRVDVN